MCRQFEISFAVNEFVLVLESMSLQIIFLAPFNIFFTMSLFNARILVIIRFCKASNVLDVPIAYLPI